MSQYLLERLRRAANVTIETSSQVVELLGDDHLRSVKIRDGGGHVVQRSVGGLFIGRSASGMRRWPTACIVPMTEEHFLRTASRRPFQ
jgi:thioredoxin reductase